MGYYLAIFPVFPIFLIEKGRKVRTGVEYEIDIEKLEKWLENCGKRLEREQYGSLARIPRFLGNFTVRGNSNFLEKLELTTP